MTPRESEAFVADLLGFTLQPGSGNQIGKKGDFKGQGILVEHKFVRHDTRSITFSRRVAMKIAEEAMLDGRRPMLTYHAEGRGVWRLTPIFDTETRQLVGLRQFWVKQSSRIPAPQLVEVKKFLLTFETVESTRLRNWIGVRVWKP